MEVKLSRPYLSDELKERIWSVVKSEWYILGERTKKFEVALADFFGVKYAVCVSSGTSALFLALKALGIGEGDEVIIPSLTAFPTAEAVFHTGATPVFADIDDFYTLDPDDVEAKLTERTKAIMPVHLYGQPADMERLTKIAQERGIYLVEDNCQAHGAEYHGKKTGSIGICGCISFYPSKNLTVFGDGGAVLTNSEPLKETVSMLRNHGRKEKYTHELVGYNMRFNEIQAEIGLFQLEALPKLTEKRRSIASTYIEELKDLPIKLPKERPGAKHVYHLFVIEFEERDALAKHLKEKGVQTGIHYPVPCHMQPGTEKLLGKQPELKRTEEVVGKILSLPIYPTMTEEELSHVIRCVRSFF